MGHRTAAFQIASTRSVSLNWGHSTSTRDRLRRETPSHLGWLRSVSLRRSTRHADCSALRQAHGQQLPGASELIEEVA